MSRRQRRSSGDQHRRPVDPHRDHLRRVRLRRREAARNLPQGQQDGPVDFQTDQHSLTIEKNNNCDLKKLLKER